MLSSLLLLYVDSKAEYWSTKVKVQQRRCELLKEMELKYPNYLWPERRIKAECNLVVMESNLRYYVSRGEELRSAEWKN